MYGPMRPEGLPNGFEYVQDPNESVRSTPMISPDTSGDSVRTLLPNNIPNGHDSFTPGARAPGADESIGPGSGPGARSHRPGPWAQSRAQSTSPFAQLSYGFT